MNILVTGAYGFIGKNLVETLKTLRDGRNQTRPNIAVHEIFEIGRDSSLEEIEVAARQADVIVHLAGVNRPEREEEFVEGNVDYSETLCDVLTRVGSKAVVIVSSSKQATLEGRYAGSAYGLSKKAGEEVFLQYAKRQGVPVYVYRLPNVFGKWCKPNYNSVVATFCHHLSRELPIEVSDSAVELELVYIDDVVEEFLDAIEGHAHVVEGTPFYRVPVTHHITLGELVAWLEQFKKQPEALMMSSIPEGSFAKKLYSTYLSYLPSDQVSQVLTMHTDNRGSFTELLKTVDHGQVSINISKPGITKGEHWHHSKWEIFVVVSGEGVIQQRKVGLNDDGLPYPVIESYVNGKELKAVYILPGYTHNIINLSQTEDLVTVMWVNEPFNPQRADTYYEPVYQKTHYEGA